MSRKKRLANFLGELNIGECIIGFREAMYVSLFSSFFKLLSFLSGRIDFNQLYSKYKRKLTYFTPLKCSRFRVLNKKCLKFRYLYID